jgi:transposase-like protein
MLCRRCGILGDPIRLKWWHKFIPRARRYYCAACGRTYLALDGEPGSTAGA